MFLAQGTSSFAVSVFFPAPHTVLGAPPRDCRGMEQRVAGGGTESPRLRESASPEEKGEKGESPTSSGPPQSKMGHLEVNGGPANPRIRLNSSPLRPLGGVAVTQSLQTDSHMLNTNVQRWFWSFRVCTVDTCCFSPLYSHVCIKVK